MKSTSINITALLFGSLLMSTLFFGFVQIAQAANCVTPNPYTLTWGACSVSGYWNVAAGGYATGYDTNSADGYSGSVQYYCNGVNFTGPTSSVCNARVNGSCSGTHWNCNAGSSVSNSYNSTNWTWQCQGSYGGTTASCTQACGTTSGTAACSSVAGTYGVPASATYGTASYYYNNCTGAVTYTGGCYTPVNGSCSATHYNCSAGTSGSNVNGSTAYTWSCNGIYGGTNASCSETKPPTAGTISITPTSGPYYPDMNLTLSFPASGVVDHYYVTINTDPELDFGTTSSWSNVVAAGTWVLKVRACNSGGCSGNYSKTVTVVNRPVNGLCGGAHYDCKDGVSASNVNGSTAYTWICNGLYGGTNASCSETKPVNGACSTTHYNCSAGTSASNVDGSTAYTWSCNGSNGGTNASCSETKPAPTTAPTVTLSPNTTTLYVGDSNTFILARGGSSSTYYRSEFTDPTNITTVTTDTIVSPAGQSYPVGPYSAGTWISKVQECNASGCGPFAPTVTITVNCLTGYTNIGGTCTANSYTVSTSASPTAGGTVLGGGSKTYGTPVALSVVPAAGYTFTSWSGYCTGTGNCVFTMPASNVSVTANFTPLAPTAAPTITGFTKNSVGQQTQTTDVSWSSVTNATRYYGQIDSIPESNLGNVNSVTIYPASLIAGTHTFKVKGCNDSNSCGPWGSASFVVVAKPTTAPTVTLSPNTTTLYVGDSNTFILARGGSSSTYYRSEFTDPTNITTVTTDTIVSPAGQSYPVGPYSAGTWISKVQECNIDGCGPFAPTVTITVNNPAPTSAPTNISFTKNPVGQQTQTTDVSWDSVTNATRYIGKVDSSAETIVASPPTPQTIYPASLSPGTHTFYVKGCNDSNSCGPWASASFEVVKAPTSVSVTMPTNGPPFYSDTTYHYSWSQSGGTGTIGYTLFIKDNNSALPPDTVDVGPATYWEGTAAVGSFTLSVQACNIDGCATSGLNALEVFTKVPAIISFKANNVPKTITLPAGGGPVTFSWSANTTSCILTGGNPLIIPRTFTGADVINGSITIDNVTTNGTYTLSCQ